MAPSSLAFVATLLLVALTNEVRGHGLLWQPMGRQAQAYFSERNYDVTGLGRGGGPAQVSGYGKYQWPAGQHQICGGAIGNNMFESARKNVGKYKAGRAASFGVLLWNQHGGRWGFRLCRAGEKNEKKCWQLKRADGKGVWFYPPIDKSDPTMSRMWSVYGPNLNIAPWMGDGPSKKFTVKRVPNRPDGLNQFINSPVVYTNWIIPKGLKGQFFVQWYWLTGNSCLPPCSKEDPAYPNCRSKCNRPNCFCGEQGAAYPEEFWNCADVTIY